MRGPEARQRLLDDRSRLTGLRDEALQDLRDERESGGSELSTVDQHSADIATELHDREVSESLVEGLDRELAEVEHALERVEDGTYGRCEQCGEPIPDERLEAMPAARFCTRHQQRQEARP